MTTQRLYRRPQQAAVTTSAPAFDGDRTLPMGGSAVHVEPPPRKAAALDADMTMPLNAQRPPMFDPNSTVGVGARPPIVQAVPRPAITQPSVLPPRPVPADFDKTIPIGSMSPLHAAPVPGALAEYVVQPGESLSRIAEKLYGTAMRWAELFALNRDRIKHPAKLSPGTVLRVPRP